MNDIKEVTADHLREMVVDYFGPDDYPGVLTTINKWLARGDGVAVYRNEELGHPELGDVQIVSFGSSEAQLETDTPPTTLPDIGNKINWRYQLEFTYRGEAVSWPT